MIVADRGAAVDRAYEVAALEARKIEALVAIGRTQPHRPYDFRPPPDAKPPRAISEPWRIAMKAKLEADDGRKRYGKRKQTVEPVFVMCVNFSKLGVHALGMFLSSAERRFFVPA